MKQIINPRFSMVSLLLFFISVQAHGTTLFADNFNDGNANGWVVVKDSDAAPTWQVANGGYRQSNDVRGYTRSFHTGTYTYYASGLNFTDYELTVRIAPTTLSSVGVMFRYKNDGNYYRFVMNSSQGFSRLQKKFAGSFTTLAFNGKSPGAGSSHTVTIDVKGANILVYLDGDPLFGAVDSSLTGGTIGLFTQNSATFDDVLVNTSSLTPKVIVSSPVAYFVETSSTLDVSAVASNVPAGGGVKFTLDQGVSFIDKTAPFSGKFSNVALGDHTIDAVLINSAGLALPDSLARDTNIGVGAQGRYFVAMGDSITQGFADDIAEDDLSRDGRNAGGGYEPILNNFLSTQLARPVTVMDEGLGGTTAGTGGTSGKSRISSAIARHTESQYWLIMFGTNSSKRPILSGKGLLPGSAGYNGTYKDSMQRIITSLKQSKKIPILAKVPFISSAPAAQDRLIQDYNSVIDELVFANNIPVTPPDFYTYFKQHPTQLSDTIHPTGAGYQAMANLWFNALAGSGILQ
jgi:lysophospholipase L1-like esterase